MTLRPDDTSGSSPASPPGTYIVCLECGRRLAYDMRTRAAGQPRSGFLGFRKAVEADPAADRPTRK